MGPTGGRPSVFDRLRQPAYTGENRCLPCTAVNLVVAALLAAGVAALASLPAGAAAFAALAAVVYLRGYLVPGTPALTARYLPRPVLRLFGKAPAETEDPDDLDGAAAFLSACGVLDATDPPGLRPDARDAIRARTAAVRDADVAAADVASALGVDPDECAVTTATSVLVRGDRLVEWESEAALVADVAAARALGERCHGWESLDVRERTLVLSRLRLAMERCPLCDAPLSRTTETADPCCGPAYDVASSVCGECDRATAVVRVDGAGAD
jgi:hypothetical protein